MLILFYILTVFPTEIFPWVVLHKKKKCFVFGVMIQFFTVMGNNAFYMWSKMKKKMLLIALAINNEFDLNSRRAATAGK